MKKHVWIVIAVVLFFLGLIIAYSLTPADHSAPGEASAVPGKSH